MSGKPDQGEGRAHVPAESEAALFALAPVVLLGIPGVYQLLTGRQLTPFL